MSEAYLSLPQKEQALILRNLSTNKNIKRDAVLLGKDRKDIIRGAAKLLGQHKVENISKTIFTKN